MHCSFLVWPFVFEDSLQYLGAVICGPKVVFATQERLSNYPTYNDPKEVFDLFLRNTQGI